LRLGVVFRFVALFKPADKRTLDKIVGIIGKLLCEARDGLLDGEPFGIGPQKQAFFCIDVHILQPIPNNVVHFQLELALR
jgi:hypothetical protein